MSLQSMIHKIRSLPPLPKSVQYIQQLYSSGDPDISKLVKLVESDPILTSDVLANANSPLYGFSKKIVSVNQAVTLFGTSNIRSVVLATSTQKNFVLNFKPYGINSAEYSEMCNLQSALMFQWYMGVDISMSNTLIPLIFLSEMGKILISQDILNGVYTHEFKKAIKKAEDISKAEYHFTGTTTYAINALLYRHWNFDEIFIEIMEYLDNPVEEKAYLQDYANAIRVVDKAVNINERLTDRSIKKASSLAESFGYDAAKFERTARRIKEKMKTQDY